MSQIEDLLQNECIEECGRLWGCSIVLVENSHHEHIANIDDFIWYMQVAYWKLNKINKTF